MRAPANTHPTPSVSPADHHTRQRGFPEDPPPAPRRQRHRSKVVQHTIALVTLVLLGEALIGEGGLVAMRRARNTQLRLDQRIVTLRAENDALRNTVRRLQEDPRAIEDIARRELGLISPGEIVVVIT